MERLPVDDPPGQPQDQGRLRRLKWMIGLKIGCYQFGAGICQVKGRETKAAPRQRKAISSSIASC
jgi:hypothetical protein